MTVTRHGATANRAYYILELANLRLAKYSIPFCVALALCREARGRALFDETALRDP